MIRTYVDSCVFMDAWKASEPTRTKALALFADPDRELVASNLVRLELLPKATFRQQATEVEFYRRLFAFVTHWVPLNDPLVEEAIGISSRLDVAGVDALHVAAAVLGHADQLVTSENPTKPMYSEIRVAVTYLQSIP
ncbi:MAG TPA: PIN domain-containing protein [Fimbriimonas sp.]|nr:PIN domain-containing protein [Fimbriimonas sp.]